MNNTPLGKLVTIKTGKLDVNAGSPDGVYPFFTCSRDPYRINSYSYDSRCVLVAGNGDLNVKYYEGKFDAYQRTYIVESLNESILDTKYLYWFLYKYVEKLRQLSIGGVIKYIKLNNLTDPEIPLLSLSQQLDVINSLEQADALRQKRKETIYLLDEYLKSVFLEMFGDPVTNPKVWEKKQLKFFGDVITGNTPSRRDTENYSSDFIEWIKTDNIIEDNMYVTEAAEYLSEKGLEKARFVVPGAVLMACIAGSITSIGRVAIANRKVSFNQQINAIQPNENVNSLYLYWLLKISRNYVQSCASRGMKKILSKGEFEKIQFIIPPKDLQNKFSKIVLQTEETKKKMVKQSDELDMLFQSLLQRSFQTN